MNYKRYFEILIKENKKRQNEFPKNKIFTYNGSKNYYTESFNYEDIKYSFVISTSNSRKYGKSFNGFIVEIESKNNFFNELEKYKDKINQELGENLIIHWLDKDKSQNGDKWNIHTKREANIEDESKWEENAKWQIDTMIKFLKVFPKYTKNLENEVIDNNDKPVGENNMPNENKINLKIKNIMLYGAPGVGKTYNYKKLVSLIESRKYSENSIFNAIIKNEDLDTDIDKNFEKIKKENRLEFVTFHQSYSYEDFIEGFRPQDDGSISLETGIFKKLCEKARENLENSQIKEDDKLLDLDELIQKFTNYVQDSLDKENAFFIDEKITIENINNRGAFVLGGSIKSDTQRLTPDIIKRDYQLFKNKEITRYEDIKPTRESKSSYHGNARYYFMLYKKIREFEKTLNTNTIIKQKEEQKNYYIVIDEINRGNISKIFGELITLIEEDKRDIYEVTLPYSKDDIKFTIPSNLYIIATMNSTDKSIATIDIALRRRFTFLKMKPNINLVPEETQSLFENLNKFIEKTLGEDYKLGHSYFMQGLDLEFVKEYKIKPLLEEYFYGDDEKYKEALKILNIKE